MMSVRSLRLVETELVLTLVPMTTLAVPLLNVLLTATGQFASVLQVILVILIASVCPVRYFGNL